MTFPRKKPNKPQPLHKAATREPYTCPELGRTCDRPNAYDAFDLPSLYAGERKPYRSADKS